MRFIQTPYRWKPELWLKNSLFHLFSFFLYISTRLQWDLHQPINNKSTFLGVVTQWHKSCKFLTTCKQYLYIRIHYLYVSKWRSSSYQWRTVRGTASWSVIILATLRLQDTVPGCCDGSRLRHSNGQIVLSALMLLSLYTSFCGVIKEKRKTLRENGRVVFSLLDERYERGHRDKGPRISLRCVF